MPDCKHLLDRLSRIQGQIETLKKYIDQENSCTKICHLSGSIIKSMDSFKASLIQEILTKEKTLTPELVKLIQS